MVVEDNTGAVRYLAPGATSYTRINGAVSLPSGSTVDTRKGSIVLLSQVGDEVQRGEFQGGQFRLKQVAKTGMTQLVLNEPLDCSTSAKAARAGKKSKKKGKKRRHVWGKDSGGKYETHGRDSVAAVRGTKWLTTDTCSSTVVKVFEGAVSVKPKRGKVRKAKLVKAGGRIATPHRRR